MGVWTESRRARIGIPLQGRGESATRGAAEPVTCGPGACLYRETNTSKRTSVLKASRRNTQAMAFACRVPTPTTQRLVHVLATRTNACACTCASPFQVQERLVITCRNPEFVGPVMMAVYCRGIPWPRDACKHHREPPKTLFLYSSQYEFSVYYYFFFFVTCVEILRHASRT